MSEEPNESKIPAHLESLKKAVHNMRIADHMLYVTYPVIKDKRLLLKTLDQVYNSIIFTINSILQFDRLNKRITLASTAHENFDAFISKCVNRYNITQEEVATLKELLYLTENHRESALEFPRKEKIVIMSDALKTMVIDSERLKKYLNLAKSLVNKAKFGMSIA
ncbi:MAG: hypothetical protein AABX17_02660 [Nanoarchaeota archaeon]